MIGKTKTAATGLREPLLAAVDKQAELKTFVKDFNKSKVQTTVSFTEDQMSELFVKSQKKALFKLAGPDFMTRAAELGTSDRSGFTKSITTPQGIKIFDQLTRDLDRLPLEVESNGSTRKFPNKVASPQHEKEDRITEVCEDLLKKLGGPSEENIRLVETAINTAQQALPTDYRELIEKAFSPAIIPQTPTMPPITFKVSAGKIEISQKATYKVLPSITDLKQIGVIELSINYTVENKAGVPTISDVSYGLKKTASK